MFELDWSAQPATNHPSAHSHWQRQKHCNIKGFTWLNRDLSSNRIERIGIGSGQFRGTRKSQHRPWPKHLREDWKELGPHPRASERWVEIHRIGPGGKTGRCRVNGRARQFEEGSTPRSITCCHCRERPGTRTAGQPHQHGLRLIFPSVTEIDRIGSKRLRTFAQRSPAGMSRGSFESVIVCTYLHPHDVYVITPQCTGNIRDLGSDHLRVGVQPVIDDAATHLEPIALANPQRRVQEGDGIRPTAARHQYPVRSIGTRRSHRASHRELGFIHDEPPGSPTDRVHRFQFASARCPGLSRCG